MSSSLSPSYSSRGAVVSPSKRVAVIGGGVSGLVTAKTFIEKGHCVVGFERSSDFGGVWDPSKCYVGVQTQAPKDNYCYTDHPMPVSYPEWPKGDQVHAYLKSYIEKHRLDKVFHLDTTIQHMERRDSGGWTLTVLESKGKATTLHEFDFVVVCTGQYSNKNPVEFPNQNQFKGRILHSSEYKGFGQKPPKKVVVIGGSKSATDIAVHVAQSLRENKDARGACTKDGAVVHLVYRRDVWRIPYFLGGLVNFKRLLFMRAQEIMLNGWGSSRLTRILRCFFYPLIWLNFRALELLLSYQLQLSKYDMVPKVPIEDEISGESDTVTPGFFECMKEGRIVPVRSTVEKYDQNGIVLGDGTELECDAVVLATGWKQSLPFLPEEEQNMLVEKIDGQYRLYRFAVNPDVPDLGFVGFNTSFCTILSSDLIANWLVRYMDGRLAKQPTDDEMRENIRMMLDWKRRERPAAKAYNGLSIAPFHYLAFDELLADMGCAKRFQKNPLSEYFSYPISSIYGQFLESAPKYKAEDLENRSL